jgi:hypothetical protein
MNALLGILILTHGYLTADPVSADKLGLAMPDGRYMVKLHEGCDGLGEGMNVHVLVGDVGMALFALAPTATACAVEVEQKMSETPCFTIDDVCDVRAEADE